MDKETLSNYGWVVICVLVLVVMIALATPFGRYIADAVKSTTESLFSATHTRLQEGLRVATGDADFTVSDVTVISGY